MRLSSYLARLHFFEIFGSLKPDCEATALPIASFSNGSTWRGRPNAPPSWQPRPVSLALKRNINVLVLDGPANPLRKSTSRRYSGTMDERASVVGPQARSTGPTAWPSEGEIDRGIAVVEEERISALSQSTRSQRGVNESQGGVGAAMPLSILFPLSLCDEPYNSAASP